MRHYFNSLLRKTCSSPQPINHPLPLSSKHRLRLLQQECQIQLLILRSKTRLHNPNPSSRRMSRLPELTKIILPFWLHSCLPKAISPWGTRPDPTTCLAVLKFRMQDQPEVSVACPKTSSKALLRQVAWVSLNPSSSLLPNRFRNPLNSKTKLSNHS